MFFVFCFFLSSFKLAARQRQPETRDLKKMFESMDLIGLKHFQEFHHVEPCKKEVVTSDVKDELFYSFVVKSVSLAFCSV